jgi:IS30 family transposase
MWEHRLKKLSEVDREKVVQLSDAGLTSTAIAKRMETSAATVSRILTKAEKPPKRGGFGVRTGFNEI